MRQNRNWYQGQPFACEHLLTKGCRRIACSNSRLTAFDIVGSPVEWRVLASDVQRTMLLARSAAVPFYLCSNVGEQAASKSASANGNTRRFLILTVHSLGVLSCNRYE